MVSGADNINFFTFRGKPPIQPVKTGFATPTREVEKTGVNYAQNLQQNLAKLDYRPPVVGGDGVNAKVINYFA